MSELGVAEKVEPTIESTPVKTLSPKQQAIFDQICQFAEDGFAHSRFVLSGLAGTGKTTLITRVIEELYSRGFKVGLAAPTGKAASVLNSKQKIVKAQTVHKLFGAVPFQMSEQERAEYYMLADKQANRSSLTSAEADRFQELEKKLNREKKKLSFSENDAESVNDYDLIIIDEASMLGQKSHEQTLGFAAVYKPIIFVGDPGQLPPVNDKTCVDWKNPDAHLDEILRQAGNSGIIPYSHAIYRGAWPSLAQLQGFDDIQVITNTSLRSVLQASNGHQVLCLRNDTRAQLNWALRKQRNIQSHYEGRPHYPAIGETLICRQSNKQYGFFNGSTLEITDVRASRHYPHNLFLCNVDGIDQDGREVKNVELSLSDMCSTQQLYPQAINNSANLEVAKGSGVEFMWPYCITVHKAQGSEWEKVIVVGEIGPKKKDGKEWWYTAVTRAKSELVIATTEIR